MQNVYLENIGIDVRIFDFDRSIMVKTKYKNFDNNLNTKYLRYFNNVGLNSFQNFYFDTYKFLKRMNIINNNRRYNILYQKDINTFIEECFPKKNILDDQSVEHPNAGQGQLVLEKPLSEKYMLSTTKIINKLGLLVNNNSMNVPFIEEYSMENIK